MAIYFVGEYPKLKDSLLEGSKLKQKKEDLSDSLATVQAEMDGIATLLDELKGNYSGSLYDSFEQLINEITETYTTVNEGLAGAIDNMTELSSELTDFETKDNSLEQTQKELKTNEEAVRGIDSDIEEYQEILISYGQKITALKNTIASVTAQILDIRDSCDDKIQSINDFNNNIVQIRLSLASIAYGSQGYDLDQIKNLTPEEREEILNTIIQNMTNKYNEYKETYEKFAALDNMDEDEKQTFYGVLGALGVFNVANGETIKEYNNLYNSCITSCLYLPNSNNKFFSGGVDKRLLLIDINNIPFLEIGKFFRIKQILYSELYNLIIIVPGSINDIICYDLPKNKISFKIEIKEEIVYTNISKSDKGKYLLINISKLYPKILLYNLENTKTEDKYYGHIQRTMIIKCCFGGDKDQYIISGSEDAKVYLWEREYPETPIYKGHLDMVNSVELLFNDVLLSANDDKILKIWIPENEENDKNVYFSYIWKR